MGLTVNELARRLGLEPVSVSDGERIPRGGFAGDLLSYVMAHLHTDEVWVTIMTNVNVIAVASLSDAACVIVADGAEVPPEVAQSAETRGVNLFRSEKSVFELCAAAAALV